MSRHFLIIAAVVLTIPAVADAETAVIEASVSRAGKRTPVASLTLDIAADRSTSSASASGPDGSFEVKVGRKSAATTSPKGAGKARRGRTTTTSPGDLWFDVEINRGRAGRFKLHTSRKVGAGKRALIGAFRQASGEILEVAVTLQP
jgi:hypothetical protein